MAATRFIRVFMLLLVAVLAIGCEDGGSSATSNGENEVFGSAARGGTPEAGKVWQATLEAWPKQGNLSILFGSPRIQAEFENWMRQPPTKPSEALMPVIQKVRSFNDSLIALDGGWGPLPDPKKVRSMAVRGMRKTLWADLRVSVAQENVKRVADLLVVMCNLPRVCHAFDGSTRGLIDAVMSCDGIGWGMRDAVEARLVFDDQQKASIREASSWLEKPDALGVVADPEKDPERAGILGNFKKTSLPVIMDMRAKLLN